MSLRLRFALLVTLLVVALLFITGPISHATKEERDSVIAAAHFEARHKFAQLLLLESEAFSRFIRDYSWWDDTLRFVTERDLEWARVNLDGVLPFHELAALWIYTPEGELIYAVNAPASPPHAPPLDASSLRSLVQKEKFSHWFQIDAGELLELRIAPIHPSDDFERNTPPGGWLVAARCWDEAHLARVTSILGGKASLVEATAASPVSDLLVLDHRFLDQHGNPVAVLRLTRDSQLLRLLAEANDDHHFVILGFSIALIIFIILALQTWILRPLATIAASRAERRTDSFQPLLHRRDEVGTIAREVAKGYAQEQTLEHEVELREKVTATLHANETALREAIEQRVHLGRNLHDSVIQMIYAAGMGLAATRALLRDDPAEAERRLEQVRETLNETIAELRAYINDLEPETPAPVAISAALATIIDQLLPADAPPPLLSINESLAARLPAACRAHLLPIVREAVSNSLRHGAARQITVTLTSRDDHACLIIADDGRGFDPATPRDTGQGLANMRGRVADFGGKLDIVSAPGQGTRIEVVCQLLLARPLPHA